MSQAWAQSPFRLAPAQDHSARSFQLPTLSAHVTRTTSLLLLPGAWVNTEQHALDGFSMSEREDPLLPWNTSDDGPNSFGTAAPLRDSSSFFPPAKNFKSDILKAVHEIESGKMDEFLCLPQDLLDEGQEYMEFLQPMMNLAIDQAPSNASSRTTFDFHRTASAQGSWQKLPTPFGGMATDTPLSPACSMHATSFHNTQKSYNSLREAASCSYVTSNSSWNPQGAHSSRPGSPLLLDTGAFSSADFADDHDVMYDDVDAAEYQEYAELAAQVHASSMASTASMGNRPLKHGPGGSYSQLLADSDCNLGCPTAPVLPPSHSVPHPPARFAPRHHHPFAPPPPHPHRLLTEPQASQGIEAPAQARHLPRSASDGLAVRTSSAPLLHLGNRLGSCSSTNVPSSFKMLVYGQLDSGCQPSWTDPASPARKPCPAQQHQEHGACNRLERSDMLRAHDIVGEHHSAASRDSKLSFAAPLLPADICGSDDASCPVLRPSRALSTSRDAPLSQFSAPHSSPSKTQRRKISKHDLRKLFQYPIDDARKMMQVSKNAFKKTLLDCGFTGGWPQRQLVGLQKLMDNTNSDKSLTEEVKKARLVRIKLNICALMDGATSTIFEDLQKASHVYHNRRHHERSTRREAREPDCMASEGPSARL